MNDDQLYAPWGVVSPGFWSLPAQEEPPALRTSVPPVAQQQVPVGDPACVSAQPAAAKLASSGPPEAYLQRINAVMAAFGHPEDKARLTQAGADAARLDQEITDEFGDGHQHTVNIRELRGWIAHLLGDHEVAARWYLHTTGLQLQALGAGHTFTRASARRAFAMWKAIEGPAEIVAVGSEFLPLLAAVAGESSKITQAARKRLDGLRSGG